MPEFSATGYIYMYPLMESQRFARTMQDELITEIESAKPKFIVLVTISTSWLVRPNSDTHILDWMERYVTDYYYHVGLIDILPAGRTEYKWDADAAGAQPPLLPPVCIKRRSVTPCLKIVTAGAVRSDNGVHPNFTII
jgi:hypothetical protein